MASVIVRCIVFEGVHTIKYFIEPVVLAINYATSVLGYKRIVMLGLSGGGWSTTLASVRRWSVPIVNFELHAKPREVSHGAGCTITSGNKGPSTPQRKSSILVLVDGAGRGILCYECECECEYVRASDQRSVSACCHAKSEPSDSTHRHPHPVHPLN